MKNISEDILFAKSVLDKGNLVAIPTETVYGLAANPFKEDAVDKIYKLKNRPKNHTNRASVTKTKISAVLSGAMLM